MELALEIAMVVVRLIFVLGCLWLFLEASRSISQSLIEIRDELRAANQARKERETYWRKHIKIEPPLENPFEGWPHREEGEDG
jgi:hypothetical protein